ncbi:MAG: response regulator [Nitrincola lacisaponensis]|uniref:DNA-binding response regulator, LuxR family n=1 Tax=Nitrincola lacisaponensis TaxID=267850 RepID=A0A063Y4L9_9GAMM|nr:response regulator transcription factor [Nitrincola lacisaponensis]KDE39447.1 DNA-binding response regulator, LuxR family [Nitrincola lacisaponensis]
MTIRILLVDDHSIIRAGYQQILEKHPEISVVAEAETGQCAVNACIKYRPDVVVLDLSIPFKVASEEVSSACGLETIRRIMALGLHTRLLVLTAMCNEPYPSQAVTAGATGYLTKHCAPDELISAVQAVSKGQSYFSAAVLNEMNVGTEAQSPLAGLSKRELEVFSMLAESFPVAQIAESLCLSPKTVHAHRANILRKLKLKNNAELVKLAVRSGYTAN